MSQSPYDAALQYKTPHTAFVAVGVCALMILVAVLICCRNNRQHKKAAKKDEHELTTLDGEYGLEMGRPEPAHLRCRSRSPPSRGATYANR